MSIDVVVFGNVPLASWVIGEVAKSTCLNLIGVVAESCEKDQYAHHGSSLPPAYHYCQEFELPIIAFDEAGDIAKNRPVLGVSVRYNKIFKEDYFSEFTPGIVNLHGGELPRYRGSNIANYVVLNGEDRTGGTIHFISNGIDEGDISVRKIGQLTPSDTAYSVFQKTIQLLKISFRELIEAVETQGKVPRTPQQWFIDKGEEVGTYRSSGLSAAREVSVDELNTDNLSKKSRAFYFPGHQPAFIMLENKKINLVPETIS